MTSSIATTERALEQRLRRQFAARGYRLSKQRGRIPRNYVNGRYLVIDPFINTIVAQLWDLEDVQDWLAD
jgi:hypothetical protein